MPTLSAIGRLRRFLGETIPSGGQDTDTMFLDTELSEMLVESGEDLNKATLQGWKVKAAEVANLVTVAEGNSSRQMSDLHKHALDMIEKWEAIVDEAENGGSRGSVIIGSIAPRAR